jgi:hypothetical protein
MRHQDTRDEDGRDASAAAMRQSDATRQRTSTAGGRLGIVAALAFAGILAGPAETQVQSVTVV